MKSTRNRLLRRALLADAIFETTCALIFVFGANALAQSTNWTSPPLFVIGGIVLFAVAGLLYWMISQPQINRALSRVLALLNLGFALIGLLALIAFWSSLADGARWLIALITIGVGIFGILENWGLRSAPGITGGEPAAE